MSFYKNIGSPFTELVITDFEPPYPGGLPECYKHYNEYCHLKYYGKDYYFRVRIPELDIYKYSLSEFEIRDYLIHGMSKPYSKLVCRCDRCVFMNVNMERTGIHCLLRRGKNQKHCNRCVFQLKSYFEPIRE